MKIEDIMNVQFCQCDHKPNQTNVAAMPCCFHETALVYKAISFTSAMHDNL